MGRDSGIAILGLALLYMLSRGKITNDVNGYNGNGFNGNGLPDEEAGEAEVKVRRYPRTIFAPPRPSPAIVTYVSPRRPGLILKKFVTEPEWRIPTRGLVIGAETLGRGEG